MSIYASSSQWSDIQPLPLNQPPSSLCQIAYSPAYAEATAYLRSIMAANEHSQRAIDLTTHVLKLNPGSYSTWLYRAKCLLALKSDLRKEIDWLNTMSLRFEKNYQIWNHRQILIDALNDPTGEREFISKMFDADSKNYHVWSYRVWLVRRFNLWDTELPYLESLITTDVRNNSAWSHRFFILFQRDDGKLAPDLLSSETSYISDKIDLAPQNASPWNYLRGVLKATNTPITSIKPLCQKYASVDPDGETRSSHALDILASIYAAEGEKENAKLALGLLADKYDPVRKGYWRWRESLLEKRSLSRESTIIAGEETVVPHTVDPEITA